MKSGSLGLWHFFGVPEHFTRCREIHLASRSRLLDRFEHEMRPVDVRAERRKRIVKRIRHETLGSEVIQLIRLNIADHVEQAWKILKAARMQLDLIPNVFQPDKSVSRIFQSDAAHESMNLVALLQEKFRKVGAVLAGNSRDQCPFTQRNVSRVPMSSSKAARVAVAPTTIDCRGSGK